MLLPSSHPVESDPKEKLKEEYLGSTLPAVGLCLPNLLKQVPLFGDGAEVVGGISGNL